MCSSNVDPLRYPDYDCGEYGLLRSDSATVAGQTNEQCCIPFANCSELTLNAEYNTTECEGLCRGQTCTVSCNQGYYNSNGQAVFTRLKIPIVLLHQVPKMILCANHVHNNKIALNIV